MLNGRVMTLMIKRIATFVFPCFMLCGCLEKQDIQPVSTDLKSRLSEDASLRRRMNEEVRSSTPVPSFRCGDFMVGILIPKDFSYSGGPPSTKLVVNGEVYVGSLDLAGYPRGFNLAGTLENDKTMYYLPSLYWKNDGATMFRMANSEKFLSCDRIRN